MALSLTRSDEGTVDGLILHSDWRASGVPEEHQLGGQSWFYEYLPAHYNKGRMVQPPGVRLSVTLTNPLPTSVVVTPEDGWDRVARTIGLSREFQTGTPDVDARFMLSGVIGDELSEFFRSPDTHQSLNDLFNLRFDRVELFGDTIRATCRPWTIGIPGADPPDEFTRVAKALFRLRSNLTFMPQGALGAGARVHHAVALVQLSTWIVGGAIGGALLLLALLATNFLSVGELLSRLGRWPAAAGASTILVLAVLGRGYAFRGKTLAGAAFALFAIVFSGTLSTLAILNQKLDTSLPVEHSQLVTRKWSNSGRHTSYNIATLPWRSDHASETFSLSLSEWNQVRVRSSRYQLHSRAGYFGVEWIQDHRLSR